MPCRESVYSTFENGCVTYGMITSGMVVLAIGSAIGTTIAALRYPHLFHADQGDSSRCTDTSGDRLRLRRQYPRDRNIVDR